MKHIRLELHNKENSIDIVNMNIEFTSEELVLLRQYVEMVARLETSVLLQRGMTGFEGLKFDENGLSIRSGICSPPELYELLHLLRPVALERESASFVKVVKLFEERFVNNIFSKFLHLNKHIFMHGEMSLYMQISVGERQLFADSLLRTWLNGTQYHTDANKAENWAALEAVLGESNAQAVIMSQLHGKVIAIFNVAYVAKQVLSSL